MQTNKKEPEQGKVFSAEEVLRRNMSVAFDDEANQPFLAEMIKCMELYANHSQYKEITLPSQPVKELIDNLDDYIYDIGNSAITHNKFPSKQVLYDIKKYLSQQFSQPLKEDKKSVLTDEQPIHKQTL